MRKKSSGLGNRPPKPSNVIEIDDSSLAPRVWYKDVTLYDQQGEVISHSTVKNVGKNGGGFVLSYTAKMDEFIKKTSTGAVVRVFLYLAHHQNYGVDGIFGYRCSRQHICDALGLTRRSVYGALEYLIKEFLVNEIRIAGVNEYMVNPAYITVGSNRKARDKEWSQRWEFYWKHKHDKERLEGVINELCGSEKSTCANESPGEESDYCSD